MNDKATSGVHWSFWVIGALALLWNVAGVVNFFAQMNADVLATYRESERALVEGRPAWATAGFAIAAFGGAFACILLLLRRAAAYYLLIASLLGVVVATIYTLVADIVLGPGEILGIILMPLVVPAFLIWYSKRAERKGWMS